MRSNTRRFIPSQADEEAHQLSYLERHMGNIISLLADSVEGEGESQDSLVCQMPFFTVYCCTPNFLACSMSTILYNEYENTHTQKKKRKI